MELKNNTLDDLSAVVGYNATNRIRTWFAGENLYIPVEMTDECFLARLLGLDVAKRLSAEWPGEHIAVPLNLRERDPDYWRSRIWRYVRDGMNLKDVAEQLDISERRVQQIVRELEQAGIIPPMRPTDLPEGVSYFRGKYQARIKIGTQNVFIGTFHTVREAREQYAEYKRLFIKEDAA